MLSKSNLTVSQHRYVDTPDSDTMFTVSGRLPPRKCFETVPRPSPRRMYVPGPPDSDREPSVFRISSFRPQTRASSSACRQRSRPEPEVQPKGWTENIEDPARWSRWIYCGHHFWMFNGRICKTLFFLRTNRDVSRCTANTDVESLRFNEI